MKKQFLPAFILCILSVFLPVQESFSWGFYAHKRINRMAVFTLPPAMIGFYKKHIGYLTAHAVDPDRRRYSDPNEAARHFLDSDHYGVHPFDSIPHYWKDALNKYGEDSLLLHGILPWHIERMVYRLSEAFRERDLGHILHYSADLGHYVADAHVPLHTTKNYNGQLTDQKGIHAFWESRIPELKAESYSFSTGRSVYLQNPLESAWVAVRQSYEAKDSVLLFEAMLSAKFPSDQKYSFETKGGGLVRVYSETYTNAYNAMLGNMVERRMVEAVRMIGCMWYSAWVNAGQPDLTRLGNLTASDSLNVESKREKSKWRKGNSKVPFGRPE
jgi:hypothetical protein